LYFIGAGKSSLFQAICRLVGRSSVDGKILIDDIDISRITLHHLRSCLSIIPQVPVLFSGTLRYNLDPFEIYTDNECLVALELVRLKHRISAHPDGLYLPVIESGSAFSVGERQLICLARAILRQSKIVLIDEATANVDQETDRLIQSVILDKFHDRTILTIAHRLNTIAANDRILMMEQGRIANFDIPQNIFQQS